ncbi:MAG: hypothetical protein NTW56_15120 [Alphaproteobacteria bacterium]|nr:hypothetical protein [Alphaproteobacteria bacterium]
MTIRRAGTRFEKRFDLIDISAIWVILIAEQDQHRGGIAQHVAAMGAHAGVGLATDHEMDVQPRGDADPCGG